MVHLRWLCLTALSLFSLVLTPVLVLLALPFAQRRGDVLPLWMNTPDDPGPEQGMYEPQVAAVLERFGWRIKTWYWLGVRNQLNGLFYALAPKYAQGAVYQQTGLYPETKGPFLAGRCHCWLDSGGARYDEWIAVGAWSATKCWEVRIGWKVNAVRNGPAGAPIMPLLQIKPFLTINSKT